MKRGKKYKKAKEDRPQEALPLNDALDVVKSLSYSKFPGSIELHVALKLPKDKDPKSLKGAVALPHSTGEVSVKIAVFTTPEKQDEAKKAGADMYDLEKISKEVQDGNVDFDIAIASPEVMGDIASLGKELGPRGLMPNPKTGTVTDDLTTTIEEYKKGKMAFSSDETGVMHFKVGTVEMDNDKIVENISACLKAASEVVGKKPENIVKGAHLAPTMGPSVELSLDFDTI